MKYVNKIRINTRKSILFIFVILLCAIWLLPIYFLILISFKTANDYATSNFWAIPKYFNFIQNLGYVLIETKLIKPFFNSLIYSIASSGIAIFLSSLAAYAMTKLKVRGSFTFFIIIWSGMIFPIQIYLIPIYKAYLTLNLYDTKIGMILIYMALSIPFCVFVFRNYFLSLPNDFQEAARIDGCTNFQLYIRILMPNSLGPIAILFLFQGSFIWNDLILAMLLSGSDNARSVMNSLASLNSLYAGRNIPAVMAGNLISCLPIVILYLVLQKYFIQGLKLQAAGE